MRARAQSDIHVDSVDDGRVVRHSLKDTRCHAPFLRLGRLGLAGHLPVLCDAVRLGVTFGGSRQRDPLAGSTGSEVALSATQLPVATFGALIGTVVGTLPSLCPISVGRSSCGWPSPASPGSWAKPA